MISMDNKKENVKLSAEEWEKEESFQKEVGEDNDASDEEEEESFQKEVGEDNGASDEEEEESFQKEVGEDNDAGDGEEVDTDTEEQEGRDDHEKRDKSVPWIADKIEESIKLSVQPKVKKNSEDLNLNNEVVRMRKEVKRVRVLIIRKLVRRCGALKKKKGQETGIERNQRRAARLVEEIHALKSLSPDLVTKSALQKNFNFEQVCKNPKSTISDRALSRIATHPQFKKKIEDIKAAVKTFKEERMKGGGQTGKEKVQNKAGKVIPQPPGGKHEEEKTEKVGVKKIITENKGWDGVDKDSTAATSTTPEMKTKKASNSADKVGPIRVMSESKNVKPAIYNEGKDIVKSKSEASTVKSAPEGIEKKKEVEESDLESSDEEDKKEYFDDSTEERFHKQSSHSEESDDDFFIGKINKFKKKKKQRSAEGEKSHEVKMDTRDDEVESRQKSKATSFESVFCPSLAASKPGSDRGRSGDRFRGRGKPRGGSGPRDYSKQSKFIKQETERNSCSSFTKSEFPGRGFHSVGGGRGRGRGAVSRQRDHMGGGSATKQALHPSWEASKKRKEQQGQILAFQGKKIKFDDDD
ncbi:serum response factor-binding protein 1 [Brachionichthys hirsutus]|uniref:serum response factor-binding protein 1 n=1 Tax=Brachionichthys hirsutus TaxID=412623 RepID=UPI003604AD86